MNDQLLNSLTDFVLQLKGTKSEGQIISQEELETLNSKLDGMLPNWFMEIVMKFPIAGCEIDYPFYEPESDYDGCLSCKIATAEVVFTETTLYYPGFAIKDLGYFCIGTDSSGGGDPFFTSNKLGDNPPIYQVYHDVSDIGKEIEKYGMIKIADSFSDFFAKARL